MGVADVLFAGVDGKPAHDFSGTLSFAWPGVACPGPRAEGPDGAAPLFALGYGLSYAKPGDVAPLPVDAAESCGEVTALPIFNLTDAPTFALRSEEHPSELTSLMRISYAVFCLKKHNTHTDHYVHKIYK